MGESGRTPGAAAGFHDWQKEAGAPFADPANIAFWLDEQEMGRQTNYRGTKGFQWGYLERFRGK